jgi:DNA invertase Pin-like site-specific DNA recombinase
MRIGYARVSTEEQKTHAQTDALKAAGCDVVYEEKRSGGSMSRPILIGILKALRPGDEVVVYKLDRVARSLLDLLTIKDRITDAGATFRSLSETMDTSSPTGRMIFQLLGAFAEFERELIRERTKIGLRAAMDRGSKPGAPRGMPPDQEAQALQQWSTGRFTKSELARKYGVHVSSMKRAISRAGLGQNRPSSAAHMQLQLSI